MSIIVETGVGTNIAANSYVTIAETDTYFESIGVTEWTEGDDDAKEYAVLNACLYMELLDWKGQKALSTDPLVWPRRGVVDDDGYPVYSDTIPIQVRRAQMELALRYLQGKAPMGDISSGDGYVSRETIGPITVEYRSGYSANAKFPTVDALLKPWLNSTLCVVMERA